MTKFGFSDETGIWVKVSEYQHPDSNMPSITLLPMIHIGEKEFFTEMKFEMWRHDTVYFEGCYMRVRKLFHLFHRSFSASTGLTLQSGNLPLWKRWKREKRTQGVNGLAETIRKAGCDCGSCYYDELRTVRADLHRGHTLKVLKTIPVWAKLMLPFLIVIAILAAPFMNFRNHDLDDEVINDEAESFLDKLLKPFWKFAVDDRDLFLRMVLAEEVLRPRNKSKRLCVKYGEKHMAALAETFLRDFGYQLSQQRNVLAVKKTKNMNISAVNTGYGYASRKYWDDIEEKRIKSVDMVRELTQVEVKNLTSLNVMPADAITPISFSIQTDLSGVIDSLKSADAA